MSQANAVKTKKHSFFEKAEIQARIMYLRDYMQLNDGRLPSNVNQEFLPQEFIAEYVKYNKGKLSPETYLSDFIPKLKCMRNYNLHCKEISMLMNL